MKTLKFLTTVILASIFIYACGSKEQSSNESETDKQTSEKKEVPESIKMGKGVGEFTEVEVSDPLNEEWVARGEAIYDMKCSACHKLTDQKVVGPGFQGVTNRRKPEWIMNMITNVDVMLAEDPTAQKLLEECMTRMPNQNIKPDDARKILEFFRKNDMEKVGKKDEAIKS
ncbi:cytochrome c [Marivirga sp.]|uniref:cytochrome c n=1 Tax=Marivirga sp. TaxID=2018662 RepID=UPI002D7FB635|nr:cytochrome c [Marivirga sp.]HET8860960.1 cytochrome c [Marivirga sp.]